MDGATGERHSTRRAVALLALVTIVATALVQGSVPPAAADQAGSVVRRVATASITTGGEHTCALTDAGGVRCWGGNNAGQLGYGHTNAIGDDEAASSAAYVQLGGRALAIAAGRLHTCALLAGGAVRCWGYNGFGVLGYGHTNIIGDDETPASVSPVPLGGRAIAIAAGAQHTCAVLATGAIRCWGYNAAGQLGYGHTRNVGDDETPASAGSVAAGGPAVAVAAGGYHTCALLASGAVRCWGTSGEGELGYGNTTTVGDDEVPASVGPVPLGGRTAAISAGLYHSCALLAGGAVRCWGHGYWGQLGNGATGNIGDESTPAETGPVALGGRATAIATGRYHSCALLASGALRCWGDASVGQLGHGTTTPVGDNELPTAVGPVPLGGPVVAVSAGSYHSCALSGRGALRCWGEGADGRLGRGSTSDVGDDEPASSVGPVPVGAAVRVKAPTRLTLSRTPRRDRVAPYVFRVSGRVTGPFVPDAATCGGTVLITVRKGARSLTTARAAVSPTCGYRRRVVVRQSQLRVRTPGVRLSIAAVHLGTSNLNRSAPVRVVAIAR